MTIYEAYKAYKEGKQVIINAREGERPCTSATSKKYLGKAIPEGVNFRRYVWAFQFFTDTHPSFTLA